MLEGKRARRRQREKYIDDKRRTIRENITCTRLLQMTKDRDRWRSMMAEVPQDVAPRFKHIKFLFSWKKDKLHMFAPPCNILYIFLTFVFHLVLDNA